MFTHSLGRRTVLTLLVAAFALLAFASSALAVTTVTINNTSTGYGADSTAAAGVPPHNYPQNRTEQRSASISYTIAGGVGGETNGCSFDGIVVSCPGVGNGTFTYTNAGPLSLGVHKLVVTNTGGGQETYVWRIEPPQYVPLVKSSTPIGFWELDDAASSSTALDSSGNGYHGDYKNFVVKQNPALTTCENQPHPPLACDWYIHSDNVNYTDPTSASLDLPGNPNGTSGRDLKGYSAYFSGSDDHVQIENMPNPGGDWAIEAWVKPTFQQESRGIFQHVPSLWTEPHGANNMRFACSGLNDESNAIYSADILNGTFNGGKFHVVCSYSAGQYHLWVNNVASTPVPTTWTPPNGGAYQGFIGLVNKPGANPAGNHWWKGYIDDVAYYGSALSSSTIKWHYETGTDVDSNYTAGFLNIGNGEDVVPPSASDISSPANFAQYSPDAQAFKAPKAVFSCLDVGAPSSGIASCQAFLDPAGPNTPLTSGVTLLSLTTGTHQVKLVATDNNGNVWTHTHTYYVTTAGSGYSQLINCSFPLGMSGCDAPIAYYRLNELAGASTILDSGPLSPNGYNGDYKNDQDRSLNAGVSGDGNGTRAFMGQGGYAAINNISAPLWGYTMELWWKPSDNGAMMLMQQGSNGAISYDGRYVNFRPDERGGTASFDTGIAGVTPGAWYYVAATYDGITGSVYVQKTNGVTTTLDPPATVASHYQDGAGSADTLYLGYGDQLGGNGWLRGQLDEVAYYGTALSTAKLTQHFNADPPAGDVEYARPESPAAADGKQAPDASKPKTKAPSKLAAARAKVRTAAKALAKSRAKLRALRAKHAGPKAIHRALVDVKVKTKMLAKAKARVRGLTKHH